jgi:hypothetical protein
LYLAPAGGSVDVALNLTANGSIAAHIDEAPQPGGTASAGLFLSNVFIGIYFGSGVPTVTAANGSIYLRSDAAAGAALYNRIAGAWVANA